jgi:hypothetical protein
MKWQNILSLHGAETKKTAVISATVNCHENLKTPKEWKKCLL